MVDVCGLNDCVVPSTTQWGASSEIQHLRGVRQGDSLSPLLFILAKEVLNLLIRKASRDGVLRSLELPSIKFCCILYADDVILFVKPDIHEATTIKEILGIFRDAAGLHTNLAKWPSEEYWVVRSPNSQFATWPSHRATRQCPRQ